MPRMIATIIVTISERIRFSCPSVTMICDIVAPRPVRFMTATINWAAAIMMPI